MAQDGILLESGTNEVEVLEFELDGQSFGVNVLKIQAIEQYDPKRVTHIQLSHPSVVGTLLFRENCITLVDLNNEMKTLDIDPEETTSVSEITAVADIVAEESAAPSAQADLGTPSAEDLDSAKQLVLVMEFNDLKTAFLVDGVNRIHRLSWEDISPLSPFLSASDTKFTGSLQIDGREILLVDMEKIVTDILPKDQAMFSVDPENVPEEVAGRQDVQILLAEDSAVIRERVEKELTNSFYTKLKTFANGHDCYQFMTKVAKKAKAEDRPITDYIGAVISDIEMPQMDGLTLCRNIKETLQAKDLPVIMFSSLINDQIARKCEEVNADTYISKPQYAKLVSLLDDFCHIGVEV